MKYSNIHNLPEVLVKALTHDPYVKVGDLSATEMLKSPRQRMLAKIHDDEIVIDVSDRYYSFMGQTVHSIVEKFAKVVDGMAEERMSHTIDGPNGPCVVSGQPDLLYQDRDFLTLADVKFTSVWSFVLAKETGMLKPEWEVQLNIYRWMFAKAGFDIDRLQIWGLLRDWKEGDAKKRADFPQCPIMIVEAPMWELSEVQRFIESRVAIHQAAEKCPEADLPQCTPEERWERGEKWAIMKNKNKTSTKNCGSQEEAAGMLEDIKKEDTKNSYRIEHRPGVSNKCNPKYCTGAPWCSYYKGLQEPKEAPKNAQPTLI